MAERVKEAKRQNGGEVKPLNSEKEREAKKRKGKKVKGGEGKGGKMAKMAER